MAASRHIQRTVLLGLLALVALVSMAACSRHPRAVPGAAVAPAIPVHTARASEVRWAVSEDITGTVRAARTATVASTIVGTIAEVRVALGDQVRPGDVLVRISAREIDARVAQAEAVAVQSKLEHDRSVALRDHAAISQAQADAALAQLRVAEGARSEARTMAEHTIIRAPFAGTVSAKLVEVGDVATPGRSLLVIEAPELLRFEGMVPETAAHGLGRGDTLVVSIDAAGVVVDGRIAEISPSADPASRTVLVKLDLPRGTPAHPGMFGRVARTTPTRTAVAVPQTALIRRGQLDELFVVEDGIARLRLVRLAREREGLVEISSGVSQGETIAIAETGRLVDGQPVEALP
jgi:RND family efflux transporter MFP subunit